MRRSPLSTAINQQRGALVRRLEELTPEAWAAACPLPALPADVIDLDERTRSVRDIVAHLLVVDGLALDRAPLRPWTGLGRLQTDGGWDRRRLAPFLQLSPDDLVATLRRSGERLSRMVEATPTPVVRMAVPGNAAPLTTQIARRVLHEWLHERDIADGTHAGVEPATQVPLPHPAVAETIADAVLQFLPAAALPRAQADGGVVRLEVLVRAAGEPAVRTWSADFGRKHYGPRVTADPDAVIRCTAATLAMLANGRGDRLAVGGQVDIQGDQALGEALVHAVRSPVGPVPCPVVGMPLRA